MIRDPAPASAGTSPRDSLGHWMTYEPGTDKEFTTSSTELNWRDVITCAAGTQSLGHLRPGQAITFNSPYAMSTQA